MSHESNILGVSETFQLIAAEEEEDDEGWTLVGMRDRHEQDKTNNRLHENNIDNDREYKVITCENPTQPDENTYKNLSNPRGHVYIFNNTFDNDPKYFRPGAYHDSNNLKYIFESMGYMVYIYSNLSKDETNTKLDEIQKDKELENVDSFIMVILSHGNTDYSTTFYAGDMNEIHINSIRYRFTDGNCPQLKDKAKILLCNYCRGKKRQKHLQTDSPHSYLCVREAPKDMVTIYASIDGFQSVRDSTKGTIFVQSLCETLAKHAHNTEFRMMYHFLSNVMKEKSGTTPEWDDYVFKKFYFNPTKTSSVIQKLSESEELVKTKNELQQTVAQLAYLISTDGTKNKQLENQRQVIRELEGQVKDLKKVISNNEDAEERLSCLELELISVREDALKDKAMLVTAQKNLRISDERLKVVDQDNSCFKAEINDLHVQIEQRNTRQVEDHSSTVHTLLSAPLATSSRRSANIVSLSRTTSDTSPAVATMTAPASRTKSAPSYIHQELEIESVQPQYLDISGLNLDVMHLPPLPEITHTNWQETDMSPFEMQSQVLDSGATAAVHDSGEDFPLTSALDLEVRHSQTQAQENFHLSSALEESHAQTQAQEDFYLMSVYEYFHSQTQAQNSIESQLVQCPMCYLSFQPEAIRLLEEHVHSHLENICPICSQAFPRNNETKFQEHVNAHLEDGE